MQAAMRLASRLASGRRGPLARDLVLRLAEESFCLVVPWLSAVVCFIAHLLAGCPSRVTYECLLAVLAQI